MPSSGSTAHYAVSGGMTDLNPPFTDVEIVYGPAENANRWMQFTIRAQTNALCTVRYLADAKQRAIARYQLRIGNQAIEYRDVNFRTALLPGWGDFERQFLPQPARDT